MSRRADRRYSAGFNSGYDYGSIPWDVRTVHGGDDDDGRNPGLNGCISASVIGYGDSVELTHRPRIRRRDRDWNRDRDRDGSSGIRSRANGDRSSFSDRERERLKQRMCLERNQSSTSSTTSSSYYHPRQQHHQARTRSLSLGRGYSYSSYSSADSEDGALERDDAWGSATVISPGRGYYHHERLSLSSPRVELADAGWPLASSRPASPPPSWHRPGRRDRYERGYVIDSRHGHDGLRFGMGPLGIDITEEPLPNPRVPSTRSTSYDRRRDGAARSRKAAASPAQSVRAASKFRPPKAQYNQVHALILTWSFHDLRTEDYTAPPTSDYVSLEEETARLRDTLEGYGYTVHEFLIPMHRSVESLKSQLKQFCRLAADDTLLIIYYHGHGALDDENELVFSSHDHPNNAEWSQAAAAELYAALLSGDACATHGRRDRYQELLKKYERYRPVATVKWDSIRGTVLSAPCDVLLVLDCCAAGGANLRHINWQPPPGTECYTKHLFAACGFESSTSDDMTAAMCEVLEEWVPPPSADATASPARPAGETTTVTPGSGSGVLTTKRLHQLMEDKLQKRSVGSQPIFKQLLPHDPEQYITLPNLREVDLKMGERRGRRGYVLA